MERPSREKLGGGSGDPGETTADGGAAGGARNKSQTATNVTFLLNNLLQQYDNSLRPDIGGALRGILDIL